MPPIDQLLGPLGLTVGAVFALGYLGRAAFIFFKGLWTEHLRVDRLTQDELVAAYSRIDAMRESNDANVKVMDRAVAQNERLVAAVLASEREARHDSREA